MSLSGVRPYFVNAALSLGYRKHPDGFAFDNIAGTVFDKSFHVEAFNFPATPRNMSDLEFEIPVTVRLFFKGYRNVDEGIERAVNGAEGFIDYALKVERANVGPDIKSVQLSQIVIEPYATTNDNYVIARIELTARAYLAIC
jgi:hypothetical protein